MLNLWVFWCCCFWLMISGFTVFGNVVLISSNFTLSFDDIEANFAPSVKSSGICGRLYAAEPLDACSPLTNKIVQKFNDSKSPFVLITRGGCSFVQKVRKAQAAGFKAAIVYDNEDGDLVAMAGNSSGIKIHAVFVSKASGEELAKYAGAGAMELWIVPSFENSVWSIMVMSFISLLAMAAVLATCFYIRRRRIRRPRPRRVQHGMSSRLVKAMPSLTFTAILEENSTSRACAICLEDYNVGEKLRILPCRHKFHAVCVDVWLTSWRTFCPVCKHDAIIGIGNPPPLESTPLLSSNPASYIGSSLASSSVIQVGPSSFRSLSSHSISSIPHDQHSLLFPRQLSQSSIDYRNMSPQRSYSDYLVSPPSSGYTSLSPLGSRYVSLYIPSPSNASCNCIESSNLQRNPPRYSELASRISPFASAPSLPGC